MKTYKSYLEKISLVKEKTVYPRTKIATSRQAFQVLEPFFHENMEVFECFYMLTLNTANNTTGYAEISRGGVQGTVVDVRMVAKIALENLATAVIVAHNHPSGAKRPSNPDISLTKKLKAGLNTLDIKLLDHIILTVDGYYSFADDGML